MLFHIVVLRVRRQSHDQENAGQLLGRRVHDGRPRQTKPQEAELAVHERLGRTAVVEKQNCAPGIFRYDPYTVYLIKKKKTRRIPCHQRRRRRRRVCVRRHDNIIFFFTAVCAKR